jgi:hypothetical protein
MKRKLGVLLAIPAAVAAVAIPTVADSADGSNQTVLQFDVMAGVIQPFTGTDHPVRGVPGGGLPWDIDRGKGLLRGDGLLKVNVKGLVLARRDPVPADLQGTNPVPQFRGAVNCLTPAAPDTGETVLTAPVPATTSGDAVIKEKLTLPEDCIAPIVMVTSPTGAWFAATGH